MYFFLVFTLSNSIYRTGNIIMTLSAKKVKLPENLE